MYESGTITETEWQKFEMNHINSNKVMNVWNMRSLSLCKSQIGSLVSGLWRRTWITLPFAKISLIFVFLISSFSLGALLKIHYRIDSIYHYRSSRKNRPSWAMIFLLKFFFLNIHFIWWNRWKSSPALHHIDITSSVNMKYPYI